MEGERSDNRVHYSYSNFYGMFGGGGGSYQQLVSSNDVGLAVGIAVVVVSICGWWYILLRKWAAQESQAETRQRPVPPGSFGLPLLGETLEWLRLRYANKYGEFFNSRVAKYGQVFKTHLFFAPAVSASVPEWNKLLFANESKLVQKILPLPFATLLGPKSLANKTGEEYKCARRIYTSFFGKDGLQSFVPRIDKIAKMHLAKFWEGKDDILGAPTLKQFTFAVVAELFLSLSEGPEFESLAHDTDIFLIGISRLPINFPGTAYRKAILARERICQTLDKIICRRRKDIEEGKVSKQQDLLSIVISTADDQGHLSSDNEIKDNILTFLFAGHDTTTSTLAVLLKNLFLNPQCLEEVVREQKEIAKENGNVTLLNWDNTRKMKYTWHVIQESMRVQPVAGTGFRQAVKQFEYGGFTIPKGWNVFWDFEQTCNSPDIFPNPERFDPSRFEGSGPPPYTYVPFGGGPRMCLGNEFARTKMVVFMHYLVMNYEWSMVDPDEKIRIDPFPTFEKGLQLKVRTK